MFVPRSSSRGGDVQDPLLVLFEVSGATGTVELAETAPVALRSGGVVCDAALHSLHRGGRVAIELPSRPGLYARRQ